MLRTALVIILIASAGCYTHEEAGAATGAVVGGAAGHAITRGSFVGTLIGAVIGAAIGADIGRQLDEADRREAAYALEYVPSGVTHHWVNPDTGRRYSCRPTRTFTRRGRPCRAFSMVIVFHGQSEELEGEACRDADGTWRTLR